MQPWIICCAILWAFLSPSISFAESTGPFAGLINESDYIAQYQVLTRNDGGTVTPLGRRLVRVYWRADKFDVPTPKVDDQPWNPKQFNRATDSLTTEFVFYGRGQHFWTTSAHNGIIEYPGKTAHPGTPTEVLCSETEFDTILADAAKLKKQGSKIEGNLELSVLGNKQKCDNPARGYLLNWPK